MAGGMIRDRRTGRKRRVNAKLSRIMKQIARKRKGRPQKSSVIAKRLKSLRVTMRTGRTRSGRRVIR